MRLAALRLAVLGLVVQGKRGVDPRFMAGDLDGEGRDHAVRGLGERHAVDGDDGKFGGIEQRGALQVVKSATGTVKENDEDVRGTLRITWPSSARLISTWLCPKRAIGPARYTSTRSSERSASMR